MEIARAVVLAVPLSDDRPWSCTGSTPKALVPVATRPIIFHTLDALRGAGVEEALIFAPADAVDAFRDAVGDGSRWAMRIACRDIPGPLDIRTALCVAGDFVDGESVIVHEADALMRLGLKSHVSDFAEERLDALALTIAPERLPRPSAPPACGYLLGARAASIVSSWPAVADPLTRLRRRGAQVREVDVEGCLACHGDEGQLLEANRHALSALRPEVTDAILEECEIQGNVVIHATASLRNTLVRGPAIIGAHTEIIDSYVGPYTSIGAGARIQGSEIEHSIVMDGAKLTYVGSRLETSIIGRGASIARRFELPSAVRMSLGDGAEVALS